jgi:hypothetical protein
MTDRLASFDCRDLLADCVCVCVCVCVRVCVCASTGQPVDPSEWDCHTYASLLKKVLRELPPFPLLRPLYQHVPLEQLMDLAVDARIEHIRTALVQYVAKRALAVLKKVMLFLYIVQRAADKNRMTATNLGIVFGPTLFPLDSPHLMKVTQSLCSFMIEHASAIFNDLDPRQAVQVLPNDGVRWWKLTRDNAIATISHNLQAINGAGTSVPVVCISLHARKIEADGSVGADICSLPDGSSWASDLADVIIHLNEQQNSAIDARVTYDFGNGVVETQEAHAIRSLLRRVVRR